MFICASCLACFCVVVCVCVCAHPCVGVGVWWGGAYEEGRGEGGSVCEYVFMCVCTVCVCRMSSHKAKIN